MPDNTAPNSTAPNSAGKLTRMGISAIVTFMVAGMSMMVINNAGLGGIAYLPSAFIGGLTVSLVFPEIWAIGPLIVGSFNVAMFVAAFRTEGGNLWPLAVGLLVVWFVVAYLGAAIGLTARRFWRT